MKFSILIKSSLSIIFFIIMHAFGVVSKESLPFPRSSRFSPMLSSVIRFEFLRVCVKCVRTVSKFIYFFAYGCPIVPALFVKKIIFAPLYCLASCSYMHMGVLLGSLFCSVALFVLLPIPHCLITVRIIMDGEKALLM